MRFVHTVVPRGLEPVLLGSPRRKAPRPRSTVSWMKLSSFVLSKAWSRRASRARGRVRGYVMVVVVFFGSGFSLELRGGIAALQHTPTLATSDGGIKQLYFSLLYFIIHSVLLV